MDVRRALLMSWGADVIGCCVALCVAANIELSHSLSFSSAHATWHGEKTELLPR